MAPRSRTGCLTCRGRKLKCSEERPVCAQCAKANRECIPSSGITFRHQQNPSMNAGAGGEEGLKNFYGYKETFGKDTTWVDVPKELTFVYTNNPYEDTDDGPGGIGGYIEGDTSFLTDGNERYGEHRAGFEYELAQAAYPAYATQGLEALSAVASQDHYSYASAPPPINQHEQESVQQLSTSPQRTHTAVSYILNPPSTTIMSPAGSNIDPQLHSEVPLTQPSVSSPEIRQKFEHDPTEATIAEQLLRSRS